MGGFQAALYVFVIACITAGLLGCFGNGWLSWIDAPVPGSDAHVEYDRYLRAHNEAVLKVTLLAAPSTVVIRISQSLADAFKVSDVLPRPATMQAGADGIEMEFPAQGGRSEFIFRVEPATFGAVHGWVEVLGGRLPINLLIYP